MANGVGRVLLVKPLLFLPWRQKLQVPQAVPMYRTASNPLLTNFLAWMVFYSAVIRDYLPYWPGDSRSNNSPGIGATRVPPRVVDLSRGQSHVLIGG